MKKKQGLPEGFRVISYCTHKGAADDPYDWGEWAYALQQWKTWTKGVFRKREVSGWVTVERSVEYDRNLVETAHMIAKGRA